MPSTPQQPACTAVRADGTPCRAPALGPGRACFAHDAAAAAAREAGRRKGGRQRSNLARVGRLGPARLRGLYERLEQGLEKLEAGELEPRRASAVAALAGAMIKCLTTGELEERVRALEAHTEQRRAKLDGPRWPA